MTSKKVYGVRQDNIEDLRKAIADGAASGPGIRAETVLKRLEAKYHDNASLGLHPIASSTGLQLKR